MKEPNEKEPYEKPIMDTEKLDVGLLMAGGSPMILISVVLPFFHICPPC